MSSRAARILSVVGARPNYMKIAPIMRRLLEWEQCEPVLLHTGQHYDANMSDVFFRDLGLPAPDIHLGIGSGTHAEQTARILLAFEPVVRERRPDLVIVAGDVNSTVACALTAVKLGVPVAHVEAGLRSFDRTMPEEINRLLTDSIAELLFTPSEDADENLLREGIAPEKIHRVGNVMADSLHAALPLLEARTILRDLGVDRGGYGLMTLHRPGNVDERSMLVRLTDLVRALAGMTPLLVPLHPRTTARLREFGLDAAWDAAPGLQVLDPLGYLDFMALMRGARYVLTDSGGIQEETTILGIPCLTLRPNTERPVTVTMGTNVIVGEETEAVPAQVEAILQGRGKTGSVPPLWEGRAAERIVEVLRRWFAELPA